MEPYLIYFFKTSIGIFFFYLLYQLILRNETYYTSNRIYLVFGLALAVLLPLFPITYISTDVAPILPGSPIENPQLLLSGNNPNPLIIPNSPESVQKPGIWQRQLFLVLLIYICGAIIFLLRLILQTAIMLVTIQKSKKTIIDGITIINLKKRTTPFSFFNVVFININEYSKEELSNIIAHEKVHIQERHWVDLLIVELLTVVFWMNPIVWLYERSIKQNHEYLADQGVLLAGYNPGQYQALLINQLMGVNVMGFTNNLNYSLNKKRMEMMKQKKSLTIKRLKLFIALPLVAALVFAFAERKVIYEEPETPLATEPVVEEELNLIQNQQELFKVNGTVYDENNAPLSNTYIFIHEVRKDNIHPYQNTNALLEADEYVISDDRGKFQVELPQDGKIGMVIARVGYYTKLCGKRYDGIEPATFTNNLKKGIYHLSLTEGRYFAAPHDYKNHELLKNTPVDVLRGNNQTMIIVEGLPKYKNGGASGLATAIKQSASKYSNETGEIGKVKVSMSIDQSGNASNFSALASNNKKLNNEAIRIIKELNNWTAAIQEGKNVPVDIAVVVSFN